MERPNSKNSGKTDQKESLDRNRILRRELVIRVSNILDSDLHHPYLPIRGVMLEKLGVPELSRLYSFLANGIIKPRLMLPRPCCPVTSPSHRSQARYPYKLAMVEYISRFGHRLEGPPSCYHPALLEAFANYCERRGMKRNGGK